MSEKKDLLTGKTWEQAGGEELTWSKYNLLAWKTVFEKQYAYCTKDTTNPIHHCIAEGFDLYRHCRDNMLIPVVCDQQIPTNVVSGIEELTKISEKVWTTNWAADAENGPQVMGTETTLEELREKLLSAEIIDKRPVDPEKAKELKEALDEEFQKLGDKAEDDHGPDQTFIMMNRKIAALEKAMTETPPDRVGQFMAFRDIQKGFIDRLNIATRAMSILERGQASIYKLLKEYKSDTEVLWMDLESKNSYTTCPQLDAPTFEEGFIYQGLVPDEIAGSGTLYRPPPKLSDTVITLTKSLVPAKAGVQDDIEDCEEEIKELEPQVDQATGKKEKRQKERELNVKKEELRQLKSVQASIAKNMQSLKQAADKSFEQGQKCDQMENAMKAALDKSQEDFAEFANGPTAMKAIWKAAHPEKEGSSFETKIVTKTVQSQSSQSTTTANSSSISASVTVGGSFGGFGGSATVGGSHSQQQSQMQGQQQGKATKFHFECEGCYGRLNNDLREVILKSFNSDQWFVKGKEPGFLWKEQGDQNIRFYVAEIFFARKLLFYTSDSQASGQIQQASTKSASSVNVGGSATGWGVTVAADTEYGQANEKTNQQSSMKKNSKDESFSHGNLYIKFLLLKPFIPAPKRGDGIRDGDVNSVEYAKEHLAKGE